MRADVIGIDIIERGAGRAVDELAIDLPEPELVDLLLSEIGEVEGVDVENIRQIDGVPEDPAVLALQVAHRARAAADLAARHTVLAEGARSLLGAQWSAVVDLDADVLTASSGDDVPAPAWLTAFVRGATTEGSTVDLEELAVASLEEPGVVLVVSRPHLPLRGREQRILDSLALLG